MVVAPGQQGASESDEDETGEVPENWEQAMRISGIPTEDEEGRGAGAEAAEEGEPAVEAPVKLSEEDMEELAQHCHLQTLHTCVNESELPLLSSVLWRRMMDVRPPGTSLDLKGTRFKKIAKFIQEYVTKVRSSSFVFCNL